MKEKMVIRSAVAMLLSAVMCFGQMGVAGTQVLAAEPDAATAVQAEVEGQVDAVVTAEAEGQVDVATAVQKEADGQGDAAAVTEAGADVQAMTVLGTGADVEKESNLVAASDPGDAGDVLDPAGGIYYVYAKTAQEVREALENENDTKIILQNDISEYLGSPDSLDGGIEYTPYWAVLGKAEKMLDLNGHTFKLTYALNYDPDSSDIRRNTYARRGSTLIKVGGGTIFQLYDTQGEGKLIYTGVLSSQCKLWRDSRNVIEVDGSPEDGTAEFIMNGGSIIAGETGTFIPSWTDRECRRMVSGSSVIVDDNAKVTVNAGYLEARGYYADAYLTGEAAAYSGFSRCACIKCHLYSFAVEEWGVPATFADETSSVDVNDADLYGDVGAYAVMDHNFSSSPGRRPALHFRSGTITGLNFGGYAYYYSDDKFDYAGTIVTPSRMFDTEKNNVYLEDKGRNVTDEDRLYPDDEESPYIGGHFIIYPKDEYTPRMWEKKANTSIVMTNNTVNFNLTDDIIFYVDWGGTDTGSWSDSVWPAPLNDGATTGYPTGQNAPAHTISYDWRIYTDNTCTKNVTMIKHVFTTTNKFNPRLYLNENEKNQLKEGKTFFVKCMITETWEGTHSYTVNATSTGYIKVQPYVPPVEVEFEHNLFNTDLTLELGNKCDPSYLNYQKKKGLIGAYDYIVKNETSGKVYSNTSTDYSDLIVPETEMKNSTVGFINVSVEVVLYKDEEKKNKITTDGQFKKTVTVGYLPQVTSPDDNDAAGHDKDTAVGRIKYNDPSYFAAIQINGQSVNADEYGITDGIEYYKLTGTVMYKPVKKDMGSGTYMSYAKKGNETIFSLNSFVITFVDPECTWDTSASIKQKIINTDTVFGSADKLSATVTLDGKTVSKPVMLWSVVSSEGNIVRNKGRKNRLDAGTTETITPGTKFKNEISLDGLVATSPQDFPEGNVTFRCELYSGSYSSQDNLVTYVDMTVEFILGYNEVYLWAMKNGKMTDVTGSWLYIDDEEEYVTIEVRGNPEFTNLPVLETYQLGDGFKPETIVDKTTVKQVSLGGKDANGCQEFSWWTRGIGTKKVTLCHPQTEFTVEGVDAPELGKRMDETKAYVPEGVNYTASVSWWVDGGENSTIETFIPNHVYTAMVRFIPNNGVIMPVVFDGVMNSLDSSQVVCKGKYGTGYEIIGKGPYDGFRNTSFNTDSIPAADGSKYYDYSAEYMTFPRLIDPDEDAEYINKLDINYDVPEEGDAKSDFSLSFEPKDAIIKGKDGEPLLVYNVKCEDGDDLDESLISAGEPGSAEAAGGSDFTSFELGKQYTCTIQYLGSNYVGEGKKYYFADDMKIFVNGSMLVGSSISRRKYNATMIDKITFTFRVVPKAKIIDSYGIDDMPEVVVGNTASPGNRMYDDRYRIFYYWFQDKNEDGVCEYGEQFSGTFETGKLYGVHIYMDVDNYYYRFADEVTIHCNGVMKDAKFEGKYTSADFLMNGDQIVPVIISSFGFSDVVLPEAGKDIPGRVSELYNPSDKDYSPYKSVQYFVDLDGNGTASSSDEWDEIDKDGNKFIEGKTYGVSIGLNARNIRYRFDDEVSVTCNDRTKNATISGAIASAEFILNGAECTHTKMTLMPEEESTCSKQGHDAYYVCDKCGTWFEEDKKTEITNHSSVKRQKKPHTPGESVRKNEVPAGCEDDGSYDEVVYCDVCGEQMSSKTLPIPATGHDWNDWHVTKEATDDANGEKKRECKKCDKFETNVIPKHNCAHTSMNKQLGEESTCSKEGTRTYYECVECHRWFEEDMVTEITDHDSVKLPKKDHTPGEAVKEDSSSARCLKDGCYDEVIRCTVCLEEISRVHHIIPALGHNFGEWKVTKAPTAGTDGQETRVCERCNLKETRSTPYLGKPVKIGSSATDDYPSIADAMKDINKAIKAKNTEPNGYNLIVGEEHTEKKAVSFPKSTTKFAITGGRLILTSPSITANSDLVISASVDSGKDNKPVTIKAGAGIDVKVYTFTTKSSVALNGKKTSNFKVDTGTKLTVTNVNAVNLEVGEGTTLKLPAKSKFKPATLTGSGVVDAEETSTLNLASVKDTAVVLRQYATNKGAALPKLTVGTAESSKLTVISDKGEFADIAGQQIFTIAKPDSALKVNGISIVNPSGDNELSAVPYKKAVRAEWMETLTLSNGADDIFYPSFEKAFAACNDQSKDYTVTMNGSTQVSKLALPFKAKSLAIKGEGNSITAAGVLAFNAKYPLTVDNLTLVADKAGKPQNINVNAPQGLTITGVTFKEGNASIKGSGNLTLAGLKGDVASITGFGKADVSGALRVTRAFTVPEISLGSTANVKVANNAQVTAKTDLKGEKGSTVTYEEGAKPVTATGSISGSVRLTGKAPANGVVLNVDKALTDDELNKVFSFDGKQLTNENGKVTVKN